jgi:hypothetical protein
MLLLNLKCAHNHGNGSQKVTRQCLLSKRERVIYFILKLDSVPLQLYKSDKLSTPSLAKRKTD